MKEQKLVTAKRDLARSNTGLDFRGLRVTVMGLGLHGGGVGVVKFLIREGAREIIVTDLRSRKILRPSIRKIPKTSRIRFFFGRHRFPDFENRDLIIRNPGVSYRSPYLRHAEKKGIPIFSDISIFFSRIKTPIIGVTGTRGKSTTATMIAGMLSEHYPRVVLAGNIRTSVLDEMKHAERASFVVLELSSFQLEDLEKIKKSPRIAVITSLSPDHLNRYRSFREYAKTKALITRFQTGKDLAVIPGDRALLPLIRGTKARKLIVACGGPQIDRITRLNPALTAYRACQARIAAAVAKNLGVPEEKIRRAVRRFRPLEGRMETVRRLKGIEFVNDTTATTPTAAAADLAVLRKKGAVILITGGVDKGKMPVGKFAKALGKTRQIFLLPGDLSERLQTAASPAAKKKIICVSSMREAVRRASGAARTGDIVALVPGAASFNLFLHEFHRGQEFVRAVKALS